MEKFVLDTNLFFNMEPGLGLGGKTEEVVKRATQGIERAKQKKRGEFLMPPSIVKEFLSFFEDKAQSFIKDFLNVITTKSPDVSTVDFPASVFYQIVRDIRERSYRGLTIAEEEVRKTAISMIKTGHLEKKEFEMRVGEFVKSLRDRYRQATRFGFLDSVADLDLIVLSKEVDGFLVSTDEGVIHWGRIFGVKEMDAQVLGKRFLQDET